MKMLVCGALVLTLAACRKPEVTSIDAEAIAATPGAATSGAASAVPTPSVTPAPSSSGSSRYTYAKQTDFLARWTIEIPTTFTKAAVQNPCTDSGCFDFKTKFAGDDIEVMLDDVGKESPSDEQTAAKLAGGGKVTAEKALPRGWWLTAPSATKHVFVQQIQSFDGGEVRLSVSGPIARRAEIEGLIGKLSSSLNIPEKAPATACKKLPWDVDGGKPSVDFDGMLVVGDGFNASMVNERPYILQSDTPVCDSAGNACWELHAYTLSSKGLPDLKTLVGKHVHITGTFDTQLTAHHHRPIMLEVGKIGVQ